MKILGFEVSRAKPRQDDVEKLLETIVDYETRFKSLERVGEITSDDEYGPLGIQVDLQKGAGFKHALDDNEGTYSQTINVSRKITVRNFDYEMAIEGDKAFYEEHRAQFEREQARSGARYPAFEFIKNPPQFPVATNEVEAAHKEALFLDALKTLSDNGVEVTYTVNPRKLYQRLENLGEYVEKAVILEIQGAGDLLFEIDGTLGDLESLANHGKYVGPIENETSAMVLAYGASPHVVP